MNDLLQVTGQDGLCWDSNPAFSEGGTPTSRSGDRENMFSCESPMIARGRKNVPCQMRSLEEFLFSDMARPESSSKRPWDEKDADYEWMEIIQMRDAGVQTDFDLDAEVSAHSAPSRSLHDTSRSVLNFRSQENEDERINLDDSSNEVEGRSQDSIHEGDVATSLQRWDSVIERTVCCQHKEASCSERLNWKCLSSPDNFLDESSPSSSIKTVIEVQCSDQVRHGCSTSGESDAFNNLPFPTAEHLDVLPEDKPVVYNSLHSLVRLFCPDRNFLRFVGFIEISICSFITRK